jgi:two-component sensor histidine kinase
VLEFFARNASEPDPDLLLTVRTLGEQVGRVLERKRTEEHQRLLINELNHRVKNTLAIVQSIAAQTLKGDEVGPETRRALESRLAALAAAHDLLTTENWETASLSQVIAKAGLGCGASDERFAIGGPDLRLEPQTAVSVAMAIHELCTNAVKYGALSSDSGTISITWDIKQERDGKRLHLVWRESGGPPVSAPSRRGFGTRLIERGLAADLGGTARIEFLADGVVCTVEAPLPDDEEGVAG